MAGNAVTVAVINQQIAADALALKTNYYDWQRQYEWYLSNYSLTAQFSSAGVTNTTDQTLIQNFVNDLNKLMAIFTGNVTIPAKTNFAFDAQQVNAWRNDANWLKRQTAFLAATVIDQYYWWLGRFQSWNTNAATAALAALGFSSGDQTAITNITADFNTLATLFNNGTALPSPINMLAHVETVLGVTG